MRSFSPLLLLSIAAASSVLAAPALKQDGCIYTDTVNNKQYDLSRIQKTSGSSRSDNYVTEETSKDSGEQGRGDYKYYMNICGPVVAPETFPDSVPDYSDAAIVQVEEDKNAAYIAGTVSGAKLYSRHVGDLRLTFGKAAGAAGYEREAVVSLICANGLGEPQFFDEFDVPASNGSSGAGRYVIIWETCAACDKSSKYWSSCPAKAAPSRAECATYTSELGKAVIIVAVSFIAAFIIIGMAYKRFVQGAKGWEQLPFIDALRSIFCCSSSSAAPYSDVGNGDDDDHVAGIVPHVRPGASSSSQGTVPASSVAAATTFDDGDSLDHLSEDDDDQAMLDA